MPMFRRWWERILARHAIPTLFVAVSVGAGLHQAAPIFRAISGTAGFVWG